MSSPDRPGKRETLPPAGGALESRVLGDGALESRVLEGRAASSGLPAEILTHLARYGSVRSYGQGEVVFEQAADADSMFIVERGSVDLVFAVGTSVKRLTPGEFFGELALVTGARKRTATAIAGAETVLRVIDQRAFEELMRWVPQIGVRLLRITCAYLLESEQRLICELSNKNRELRQTLDYLRRTKEDLDTSELLARTDDLTGLYNRRCLDLHSGELVRRAEQEQVGLALILIDIDHFKRINDRFGHPVGDLVLRRFAETLARAVRQADLPCRLGGDEFAVLQSMLREREAEATAKRLLSTVGGLRVELVQQELRITCSIGGTGYRHGEGWDTFLARADHSLYLAKEKGRNRLVWDDRIAAVGGSSLNPE